MPPHMEDIVLANLAQLQVDPNFAESLWFQEAIKHMDTCPFFEAIQEAPVSEMFTIPHFKLYAGMTDPVMHILLPPSLVLISARRRLPLQDIPCKSR